MSSGVMAIRGRLESADIAGLCREVSQLLGATQTRLVVCDVGALVDPDAVAIDAVARLQLTAQRLGARVILRRASGELRELLSLSGLEDVVPYRETSLLDPLGEAEEREQALGVEEERETGDPTI